MTQSKKHHARKRRGKARRAAAMLLCLFVISVTSLVAVAILDTQTSQWAALRNTADYERALYLAGSGVHHALAELEADFTWRDTVTEGSYPASGSYSATAVDGESGEVTVTSTGVSGSISRNLEVTVVRGS